MHILKTQPCNTVERLLSREEMMDALELLVHRMDIIDTKSMNGFPLYSPAATDRWTISPGGSWAGGFWSGWWWLRSRLTGSASDRRKASEICQRLTQKISADSLNRSLIFWYGAALGSLWFGDAGAQKLAAESIVAIGASYDPEMDCIPLGTDMGGGKEGNQRAGIDTLASLIQLFNSSQHNVYHDIAHCHTDTVLRACFTGSGAFHADAYYRKWVLRPTDQAGDWSRGQAWGMLGLSRAAAHWGEPYLTHARIACEYWKHSRPEAAAPLNRLSHPSGPPHLSSHYDPSSSVIACLAMLCLAALTPDGNQWRIDAHRGITAVIRSPYFTVFQEHVGDQGKQNIASGIFWGCCYETHHGKNELVESAWGSFFLMAALCILTDVIEPHYC
ncbi:glucuronyl hydrolase [Nitrosovibrio tenuis]|uniref:Unsaturated chondroitin disaccharide hydrolase n=1 Tax=Nitrosovibrio tenuis TaxID=1233 RepID=A0A1H7Q0M3_9PROT|nr:glucuronyl hydrolase [Nitrosovibrio tenuis]SEL40867.1 unsaturated chondroitin disaccharide hydrolase [Nitrosovibrio tenuis]